MRRITIMFSTRTMLINVTCLALILFPIFNANIVHGEAGQWSVANNSLPSGKMGAVSVEVNGYIYEIGGDNGVGPTSDVYFTKTNPDGSVGPWTISNNQLPNVMQGGSAIAANGYIYVVGKDYISTTTTNVYYAQLNEDGTTGAWLTSSSLLPIAESGATMVEHNDYIYVIGGNNGYSNWLYDTVYFTHLNSDGSLDPWSLSSSLLPEGRLNATSVIANGYIYEMGGYSLTPAGFVAESTVYYAHITSDGTLDSWVASTNSLPSARAILLQQ